MDTLPTNTTWKFKITELNKKGYTNAEIAEMLGTSAKHIQKLCNAYKIISNKRRKIEMDSELFQFFLGNFLGDGTFKMASKKSKNPRYSVGHGEKQTEYLLWKEKFLKNKNIRTNLHYYTAKDSRIKKGYYVSGFLKSEANPVFMNFYEQYSPKKNINYNFVKKLDAFGLAVWYMDDGFVTKNSFQISTCGFTIEEVSILQRVLLENFNIKTNQVLSKEIYILAESRDLFIEIIKPFIIPSLEYKLIPYANRVLNKQGELLEHPKKDNQQPSLDSNIFEGSTTNNRVLPDNAEDSNVNTSTLPGIDGITFQIVLKEDYFSSDDIV